MSLPYRMGGVLRDAFTLIEILFSFSDVQPDYRSGSDVLSSSTHLSLVRQVAG